MPIPSEYNNREQTYLKHQILKGYLGQWGHKLGSIARKRVGVKLWYVDCFAGPWRSQDGSLEDTSIYIGLSELRKAAESWRGRGFGVQVGAIFVEKRRETYRQLAEFVGASGGDVECHAMHGEFGDRVPSILELMGDDPAFVFVDPTGFKGADMRHIARLADARMRDVLVNVMFNDINRWKNDERDFLRKQMCDFFGIEDGGLPKNLSEVELLRLYRKKLKEHAKLRYAADLAVPHPTHKRTWFRLVVGGNNSTVLEVFRAVESGVVGSVAAVARTGAVRRPAEDAGQHSLFSIEEEAPEVDLRYAKMRQEASEQAVPFIIALLENSAGRWRDLWPRVLEELHLPLSVLTKIVVGAAKKNELRIEPAPTRSQISPGAAVRAGPGEQ